MISGHPKSIEIPRVDGLSTGPPEIGASMLGIRARVNDYLGAGGGGGGDPPLFSDIGLS